MQYLRERQQTREYQMVMFSFKKLFVWWPQIEIKPKNAYYDESFSQVREKHDEVAHTQ